MFYTSRVGYGQKIRRHIPETIEEKYHFVDKHRCKHSVGRICRELGISRSSYYDSKSKKPSRRALNNQLLLREIVQLHEKYPVYGLDSIYNILRRKHRLGRARVHRLMKSAGIHSRRHKAFKVTTNSNHKYPVSPNLLKRNFKQLEPNKVWVGDITYIRTGEGWLYLATLKDLCTKKIVGYSFSSRIDTKLTLEALTIAVRRENPAKGLLHHTDRGVQYASSEYQEKLKQLGFLSSMSRTGNPYDNAVAENFFSCLKCELVHLTHFYTRKQAQNEIFAYIEGFYNSVRPHSGLGWVSPNQFSSQLTLCLVS